MPSAYSRNLKTLENLRYKYGIRLDSGDLAYLSKEASKMLDEAGFARMLPSALRI